jgi:hypothetical protein
MGECLGILLRQSESITKERQNFESKVDMYTAKVEEICTLLNSNEKNVHLSAIPITNLNNLRIIVNELYK